jgi:hypothetical protein
MTATQCSIGELRKATDEIVTLTIKCTDDEITKGQMVEAVRAIDSIAKKPSPLFVDASQSHSVSFDALIEMAKASNVIAVAIYSSSETSQVVAKYIEQFQKMIGKAPYPFMVFSDSVTAKTWLNSFT